MEGRMTIKHILYSLMVASITVSGFIIADYLVHPPQWYWFDMWTSSALSILIWGKQ